MRGPDDSAFDLDADLGVMRGGGESVVGGLDADLQVMRGGEAEARTGLAALFGEDDPADPQINLYGDLAVMRGEAQESSSTEPGPAVSQPRPSIALQMSGGEMPGLAEGLFRGLQRSWLEFGRGRAASDLDEAFESILVTGRGLRRFEAAEKALAENDFETAQREVYEFVQNEASLRDERYQRVPFESAPSGSLGNVNLILNRDFKDSIQSLRDQRRAAANQIQARARDLANDTTALAAIQGYHHEDYEKFLKTDGFWPSAGVFVTNPIDVTYSILAESGVQMSYGLAATAVASLLTGGIGAPLAAYETSFQMEYGAHMVSAMMEHGYDARDSKQVKRFFADLVEDPELWNKVKSDAATAGMTVGAFDAATAGLAGKLSNAPYQALMGRGRRVSAQLTRAGIEAALQMTGGGGGEAMKQYLLNGEITDGKAIFQEMIAELATGPFEAALNLYAMSDRAGKIKTERDLLDSWKVYRNDVKSVLEEKASLEGKTLTEYLENAPEQERTLWEQLEAVRDPKAGIRLAMEVREHRRALGEKAEAEESASVRQGAEESERAAAEENLAEYVKRHNDALPPDETPPGSTPLTGDQVQSAVAGKLDELGDVAPEVVILEDAADLESRGEQGVKQALEKLREAGGEDKAAALDAALEEQVAALNELQNRVKRDSLEKTRQSRIGLEVARADERKATRAREKAEADLLEAAGPDAVAEVNQARRNAASLRVLAEQVKEHHSKGKVEGFFYQGKVYLHAPGLSSADRAVQVLEHELTGHAMTNEVVGEHADLFFQRVWKRFSTDADFTATVEQLKRDYPEANEARLGAEFVAQLSERGLEAAAERVPGATARLSRPKGLAKVANFLKRGKRKDMFEGLDDAQVLATLALAHRLKRADVSYGVAQRTLSRKAQSTAAANPKPGTPSYSKGLAKDSEIGEEYLATSELKGELKQYGLEFVEGRRVGDYELFLTRDGSGLYPTDMLYQVALQRRGLRASDEESQDQGRDWSDVVDFAEDFRMVFESFGEQVVAWADRHGQVAVSSNASVKTSQYRRLLKLLGLAVSDMKEAHGSPYFTVTAEAQFSKKAAAEIDEKVWKESNLNIELASVKAGHFGMPDPLIDLVVPLFEQQRGKRIARADFEKYLDKAKGARALYDWLDVRALWGRKADRDWVTPNEILDYVRRHTPSLFEQRYTEPNKEYEYVLQSSEGEYVKAFDTAEAANEAMEKQNRIIAQEIVDESNGENEVAVESLVEDYVADHEMLAEAVNDYISAKEDGYKLRPFYKFFLRALDGKELSHIQGKLGMAEFLRLPGSQRALKLVAEYELQEKQDWRWDTDVDEVLSNLPDWDAGYTVVEERVDENGYRHQEHTWETDATSTYEESLYDANAAHPGVFVDDGHYEEGGDAAFFTRGSRRKNVTGQKGWVLEEMQSDCNLHGSFNHLSPVELDELSELPIHNVGDEGKIQKYKGHWWIRVPGYGEHEQSRYRGRGAVWLMRDLPSGNGQQTVREQERFARNLVQRGLDPKDWAGSLMKEEFSEDDVERVGLRDLMLDAVDYPHLLSSPFWVSIALRAEIRKAEMRGDDFIGWTQGVVQAERWNQGEFYMDEGPVKISYDDQTHLLELVFPERWQDMEGKWHNKTALLSSKMPIREHWNLIRAMGQSAKNYGHPLQLVRGRSIDISQRRSATVRAVSQGEAVEGIHVLEFSQNKLRELAPSLFRHHPLLGTPVLFPGESSWGLYDSVLPRLAKKILGVDARRQLVTSDSVKGPMPAWTVDLTSDKAKANLKKMTWFSKGVDEAMPVESDSGEARRRAETLGMRDNMLDDVLPLLPPVVTAGQVMAAAKKTGGAIEQLADLDLVLPYEKPQASGWLAERGTKSFPKKDLEQHLRNVRVRLGQAVYAEGRNEIWLKAGGPVTKGYAQYGVKSNMDVTEPGGDAYTELILELQMLGKDRGLSGVRYWGGGHHARQGSLLHLRYDVRDLDGERALYIQEVQSDFHQQVRKFRKQFIQLEIRESFDKSALAKWDQENPDPNLAYGDFGLAPPFERAEWERARQKELTRLYELREKELMSGKPDYVKLGYPDFPFHNKWHELAIKAALKIAAQEGIKRVAWMDGRSQNNRYDKSRIMLPFVEGQKSYFEYRTIPGSDEVEIRGEGEQDAEGEVTPMHMKGLQGVPKKLADAIRNEEGEWQRGGWTRVPGERFSYHTPNNLRFYDQDLVNRTRKLLKKTGVEIRWYPPSKAVGKHETPGRDGLREGRDGYHFLDLNDAALERVQEFPLFSKSGRTDETDGPSPASARPRKVESRQRETGRALSVPPASSLPKGVTYDADGNLRYNGKAPEEWTPREVESFGLAFNVPNLGPLTQPAKLPGSDVEVPGGAKGTFTFLDLMELKARLPDITALAADDQAHVALQRKLAKTMEPSPGDSLETFNRMVFGMLSPNAPLLPNEFAYARLRARSREEVKRLANVLPEKLKGTKAELRAVEQEVERRKAKPKNKGKSDAEVRKKVPDDQLYEERLRDMFGIGEGGQWLGLGITQRLTNISRLARLWLKNPKWFEKRADESWHVFTERLQTQVAGMGSKVAIFSSVWQDPLHAAVSAIDRHMAGNFAEELISKPALRRQFDNLIASQYNSELVKGRKARDKARRRIVSARKALESGVTPAKEKRLDKAQEELAEVLENFRGLNLDGAKKVKTVDQVMALPAEMLTSEGKARILRNAVLSGASSQRMKYRTAKGEVNPRLPAWAQDESWVADPEFVERMSEIYRAALDHNERLANQLGLSVFPSQWLVWDRIRKRIEPHEIMFPGYYRLPRMGEEQFRSVLGRHSAAGYMSLEAEMKPTERPQDLLYFSKSQEEPATGRGKFAVRVLEDERVPASVKDRVQTEYEVQANEATLAAALEVFHGESPEATWRDTTNDLDPATRGMLGQILLLRAAANVRLAEALGDGKLADDRASRAADLANEVAEQAREWGRGVQVFSAFSLLDAHSLRRLAKRQISKAQKKRMEGTRANVRGRKEAADVADQVADALEGSSRKAAAAATGTSEAAAVVAKVARKRKPTSPSAVWGRYKRDASRRIVRLFGAGFEGSGPKVKPALQEFTDRLIRHAREKVREEGVSESRAPREKLADRALLTDLLENPEKYLEVWEDVGKELVETYRSDPETLRGVTDVFGRITFDEAADKVMVGVVREELVEMRTSLDELARRHFSERNATEKKLVDRLVVELGLSDAAAAELGRVFTSSYKRILKAEAKRQLDEIVRKAAAPKVRQAVKTQEQKIIELANLGGFEREDVYNAVALGLKLPQAWDPAWLKNLERLALKIQESPEGFQRNDLTVDLLNLVANKVGDSAVDVMFAVRYANLLSGFSTQLINAGSNFAQLTLNMFGLAARSNFSPATLARMFGGLYRGFVTGGREAVNVLATGRGRKGIESSKYRHDPVLERVSLPGGRANPFSYLKYVTRFLAAMDAIFRFSNMEAYGAFLATQLAKKQGLKGEELDARVQEILALGTVEKAQAQSQAQKEGLEGRQARRREDELMLQERDEEFQEELQDFALHSVFQQKPDGVIGVAAGMLNAVAHPHLRPGEEIGPARALAQKTLQLFVPFINTVANVANTAIEYTPVLGTGRWALASWKGAKSSEQLSGMLTRNLLGTLSMGALQALLLEHEDDEEPAFDITGGGPKDWQNRKTLIETTNWRPWTITIFGKQFNYGESPLAVPLAVLGGWKDSRKYGDFDEQESNERMAAATLVGGQVMFDQTFLRGMKELMEILSADERAPERAGRLFRDTAGSFVLPNMVNQVDKLFDPTKYSSNDLNGAWARSIWFARRAGYPDLNLFGEPATRFEGSLSERFLDRLEKSTGEQDELVDLMVRNKYLPRPPSKGTRVLAREEGVEEKRLYEAYYLYSRYAGQEFRQLLEKYEPILRERGLDGVPRTVAGVEGERLKMEATDNFKELAEKIYRVAKKRAKVRVRRLESSGGIGREVNLLRSAHQASRSKRAVSRRAGSQAMGAELQRLRR